MEASRLLGFAFAGADLLFEVDSQGVILFATGATRAVTDRMIAVGQSGAALFKTTDGHRFLAIARGMTVGNRIGPLSMTLASGEKISLSMCYLPQNDRISCSLLQPGARSNLGSGSSIDAQTGLSNREAFIAAAALRAGGNGVVTLVNIENLPKISANLSPKDTDRLLTHIGANMKALGSTIAARISDTGFGIFTEDRKVAESVVERLQKAAQECGVERFDVEQILVSLADHGLTAEQTKLALRHVVGRFTDNELKIAPGADLADVFNQLVNETIDRAQRFNATVAHGAFDLAFEAIVDLKTGITSHYEVLTRFQPGQSPAETIRFAEQLGLADTFDFAVAVKVFTLLEQKSDIVASVALNVSGQTIATPSSFAILAAYLEKKKALAKRVLIEITETADLSDLAAADKAIQVLRQMGYRVGIDDFGSGAASLSYLHALSIDFVKIDGALVRRLGKSSREDALLKSLATTCADIHIETIAEWIDSDEKLRRCRDIGFRFGQGHHFGGGTLKELPRRAANHR